MTTWHSLPFCLWYACVNSRLTLLSLFSPSLSLSLALCFFLHPSPQGVVPVRHQLPGCETQQPGCVGDQTGNGTRKQYVGSDVSEKGLLHSREVGWNLCVSCCFFFVLFCQQLGSVPLFYFVLWWCIKCLERSVIILCQGHKPLWPNKALRVFWKNHVW